MMEPDALGHDARRAAGEPLLWGRLRRRAEFQRVSRGRRAQVETFTLQVNARAEPDANAPNARIGFTVTKKVGGAVERNRIRRRLKEALRQAGTVAPFPGHDYVVMARRDALMKPFAALVADIERAFAQTSRLKPLRIASGRGAPATDREQRS